ncbi:LacI family DNA-binding transcriptional regulator [Shigella flexneri]
MSPTIYDIARVAGVSKSTVSRVLNKQTNISRKRAKKCYGPLKNTVSAKQAGPRADLFGF